MSMKGWLLGKVHGQGHDDRRVAPSLQGDPVAALDGTARPAGDAERRSASSTSARHCASGPSNAHTSGPPIGTFARAGFT